MVSGGDGNILFTSLKRSERFKPLAIIASRSMSSNISTGNVRSCIVFSRYETGNGEDIADLLSRFRGLSYYSYIMCSMTYSPMVYFLDTCLLQYSRHRGNVSLV